MTFQEPALFNPPGALRDSIPELDEGFIYYLEVDRVNSHPVDYNRLQFLNRHILVTIRDDDGTRHTHTLMHTIMIMIMFFVSSSCYL
jgi:hypothetical protein